MKLKYYSLIAFVLFLVFTSCKKDDNTDFTEIPLRDRTEQQVIDKDSLIGYLETHYYNSSTFDAAGDHTISELEIEELLMDVNGNYQPLPANSTLLIDAVETHMKTFMDVEYEYYILRLNQGGGKSPHFPDNVRVRYSGNTLDEAIFDSNINPADIQLVGNNVSSGAIQGWKDIIPQFNAAESFAVNGDGTVAYSNYGLGVMFLPSGLGYFGTGVIGIPVYSNLIFKFELYQFEVADHDNDGIPSYAEDLNNNGDLLDDLTDSDIGPDFIDNDDDNDGVLTINELEHKTYTIDTNMGETEPVLAAGEYERSRTTSAGIITLKTVKTVDSNSDGIPDYLDKNIAINNNP